ncbi:MAG: 6-phospho-beta-glucosidase, partial [Candidatus Dormibacteraceae bacterium]
AGLNHFGWLFGVRDAGGSDLLPGLLADEARLAEIEEARLFGTEWLRALGMIPNEYLFYYDRTAAAIAETVRRGATRGESLLAGQAGFYAGAEEDPKGALQAWRETRLGRERTYLGEAGAGVHNEDPAGDEGGYADVALDVATALFGGDPVSAVVNVPNRGTLPDLDGAAIVEVPCRVDADGAHPLPLPHLPPAAAARVGLMKAIDRLVLEAAAERSRPALQQAFGLHPLCGGIDGAAALVERALGAAEVSGGPA